MEADLTMVSKVEVNYLGIRNIRRRFLFRPELCILKESIFFGAAYEILLEKPLPNGEETVFIKASHAETWIEAMEMNDAWRTGAFKR